MCGSTYIMLRGDVGDWAPPGSDPHSCNASFQIKSLSFQFLFIPWISTLFLTLLRLQKSLDALGYESFSTDGYSLSPSKAQLAPHRNSLNYPTSICVINPHHPSIAARSTSTSNISVNPATTPTSPRPSATDLVSGL